MARLGQGPQKLEAAVEVPDHAAKLGPSMIMVKNMGMIDLVGTPASGVQVDYFIVGVTGQSLQQFRQKKRPCVTIFFGLKLQTL